MLKNYDKRRSRKSKTKDKKTRKEVLFIVGMFVWLAREGEKQQKEFMKNYVIKRRFFVKIKVVFFIASVVLFYQVAHTFAIKPAVGQTAQLEKAKTYKTGDTVGIVMKDISTSVDYDGEVGFDSDTFYKNTGKHAAIVRVWLINLTEKTIKVDPVHFKAITNNGFTLSIDNFTHKTTDPFQRTELGPKEETQGLVVFGLNTSDTAYRIKKIIYDDQEGNRITRDYNDAVLYGLYDHAEKRGR
ncbi:MAG: DUF4352 domain-containing protein [Candidatus Kuenenia sp.]|nr:DUF4352 domain-containing protein [Candidatus Kuenenia hertensis]